MRSLTLLLLLSTVLAASLAAVYNGQYRDLQNRLSPVQGRGQPGSGHHGRRAAAGSRRVLNFLPSGRRHGRRRVLIRRRPITTTESTVSKNADDSIIGPADALRAGKEGAYDFADQFNAIIPDKRASKPTKAPPTDPNKINIESRIPVKPENLTVVEKARAGSTAIVHCAFDDVAQVSTYADAKIWWTKLPERAPERPVLLAAGSQVRVPDDRLRVLTYPDNTFSVLVIKNVIAADAGQYKCSLPTVTGTQTSFTSLTVLESDEDVVAISAKETVLNAGQRLDLFCRPADSSLDVWWSAKDTDGNTLPVTSGLYRVAGQTLTIERMRQNQGGVYTCHVESKVGSPVRRHFTVQVKERPWQIEAYIGGFQMNTLLSRFYKNPNYGESVDLRCDTGGVPTPTIEWYKDNTQLYKGYKYTIDAYEPSYKRNAIISKLTISDFQPADDGVYFCKARNDVGEEVQYFSVRGVYGSAAAGSGSNEGSESAALTGRSGAITVKKCVGSSCSYPGGADLGSGGYYDDDE